MAEEQNRFDLEHFERMKSSQAEAAKVFLNKKFPPGSKASVVVSYLEGGGAKCTFVEDHGHFYFCVYVRPGHGLMGFVPPTEWHVIVNTGSDGQIVENIATVRGAIGP